MRLIYNKVEKDTPNAIEALQKVYNKFEFFNYQEPNPVQFEKFESACQTNKICFLNNITL